MERIEQGARLIVKDHRQLPTKVSKMPQWLRSGAKDIDKLPRIGEEEREESKRDKKKKLRDRQKRESE